MGAVPCGAEPAVGAGRGAGVLRRRGAWRGGARRGGEGRGPAVKARPLARDQPRHRSPGARPPCGEVRGAPVSAGSEGPSQRAPPGTGEGEQGLRFFRPEARERRGVCQSLGGLRGGREPAWRRLVGRRLPSCLENKEPGVGAASAPRHRGLFPAASQEGCRKLFPKSSLGGRNPLLFCSRKGKSGPEVPVALWPSSSPA